MATILRICCYLVGNRFEVFFSPDGLISDNIIKAIHTAEESVDIAVFAFSAGEIAEALYVAKDRGVRIRVILDYEQKKSNHPVVEFLKDEGFCVRFLKGKAGGAMNNSFAIFDSLIVVTGSYRWSEYSEKFNYENAIFIDNPDIVKKFKDEFDSLYGKCLVLKEQGEEGIVLSETENDTVTLADKEEKRKAISSPENAKPEETIVVEAGVVPAVLDISFQEFDDLFGKRGTLGRAERKRVWKDRFEGRYVKWTGEIGYKGIAVYDWNKVGIRHNGNSIDVELRFDWTKKQKLLNLVIGDVITYRGRLVSLGGFMAPYKLNDVDVLGVQ